MLKLILLSVITLAAVHASGDFVILHSPSSVEFIGDEPIEQSLLTEVFAACLGYTVKQRGTWGGMSIKDPFALPEAVVVIAVEGIESLDAPNGIRFPLDVNELEETTWQVLGGRLGTRRNSDTLIRFFLADGVDALGQSALGELKPTSIDKSTLKALNLDNEEDRKFIDEVQLLDEIANKVSSGIKADNKPDVYWLVISGLRPVFDLHGRNSTAAREALFLLNKAVNVTSEAFVEAYDGKVVIAAFTNDASHVRRTRSVIHERQRRDAGNKNLAKNYNENYPIIFNIILWFGVVFFFSLLAICITIAEMDPGRDSIIYRMTSNRMKKDN